MEITTIDPNLLDKLFIGTKTFDNLEGDELSWIEHLYNSLHLFQISHDGKFIGVFEIRSIYECDDGLIPEIHCYFLPLMRKYSIKALKAIKQFIIEETTFCGILTTVYNSTKYVVRILKMLGFFELESKNEHGLHCMGYTIKRN